MLWSGLRTEAGAGLSMPRAQKASTPAEDRAASATSAKPATKAEPGRTAKSSAKAAPRPEPARSEAAPAKAAPAKAAARPAAPRGATTRSARAEAPKAETAKADRGTGKSARTAFLNAQRTLLHEERVSYLRQAEELKAEADSLALEHEPGDVQFDEEGGEGGTSNVDRELDLILSAQARAAIAEIDRALEKIESGTYGACEQCGQPIPEARLEALPYAAMCVACKSGGLSSRR